MATMKDLYQSADWKAEKHVPVIDCADTIKKGEPALVTVSVGKQIVHPNTAVHHIAWVELYFLPKGEKFPYQIGRCEFSSHGASIQGPDTSTVFTQPTAVFALKTEKSGTLLAGGYCNIHGVWENAKEISIV